jgi:hypothetical protein
MKPLITTATAADIPELIDLLGILFAIEQDFTPDVEKQRRGLTGLLASPFGQIAIARHRPGHGAIGDLDCRRRALGLD